MEQETFGLSGLAMFLPMIVISIPFAIGFGLMAKRLEKNVPLWVILSLIPLLNSLFWMYAMFIILFYIVDSLKFILKNTVANGELSTANPT